MKWRRSDEKTFFYITAGGDAKVSGGQDKVMAMLDGDGIYGIWDAQNSAEEQDAAVRVLLEQGRSANMLVDPWRKSQRCTYCID